MASIYDFKAVTSRGKEIDFAEFEGKVLLVVNGPDAQPIFEYLKAEAPSEEYKGLKAKAAKTLFKALSKSVEKDNDIKWNFTKFLISKDGRTIKRYAPTTAPKDFEKDVETFLMM